MRAYVDSNIFVYSMFAHPRYGLVCRVITEDLEGGLLQGVVSTLVLVEVMSVTIKHDPSKAETAVTSVYSLPLEILEMNRAVLSSASKLAFKYRLSGYDAVHIATSLEAEVGNVISNDDDLRKIPEITLVKPLDYEEWKGSW